MINILGMQLDYGGECASVAYLEDCLFYHLSALSPISELLTSTFRIPTYTVQLRILQNNKHQSRNEFLGFPHNCRSGISGNIQASQLPAIYFTALILQQNMIIPSQIVNNRRTRCASQALPWP